MKNKYFIIILLFPAFLYGQTPNNIDSSIIKGNLYKQTTIPLNTKAGITVDPAFPHAPIVEKRKRSSSIDGFEVDKEGYFFFLSGNQSTLSIFNKNKKVFSENYNDLNFSKIHIYQNKIYALDNKFINGTYSTENSLYILNKSTGRIEHIYKNLISNNTQQPVYLDSSLVLEVHEKNKVLPETAFLMYDLKGEFIKQINNPLNFSDKDYKSIYNIRNKLNGLIDFSFLGFWKDYRVYVHRDYSEALIESTQFTLTDNLGNIVKTYRIDSKILGNYFYGPENDFEIIRNGSIFILRRDEKVENAIITELPLNEIFK